MNEDAATLCVTSCGRLDLLKPTLESLLAANDDAFAAKLLIEDANDRAVAAYLAETGWGDGIILNNPQLGQMRSIDRLYSGVKTPLIFHCEDDWRFDPVALLPACRSVLAAEPKASSVCVRKLSEMSQRFFARAVHKQTADGIAYVTLPLDVHPEWFGVSFNPGLTRRSLWEQYGPYADHVTEERLSLVLKRDGYSVAYLDPGACTHIGDGQHVADPHQPPRAKGLVSRLKRSLDKRVARLKRRFEATH